MILENTIRYASKLLKKHNIRSHELDAEIILSNIMGVSKEYLIINGNIDISSEIEKIYIDALNRRINNEPVAYITGKKEFWSENFVVNRSTLIPRPETELLIYKVVDYFKYKSVNMLDIGTGAGCLLLSILKELPLSRGTGIDISARAIKIAKINSKNLNLNNRSRFKVFDLNKFVTGKYDLIASNPPYIPSKDIKNLCEDVTKYEPHIALNGGIDGLDLIKKVIYKSNILLKTSGMLALEIGYGQYRRVSAILKQNKFKEYSKIYDHKSNVRCIISTKIDVY